MSDPVWDKLNEHDQFMTDLRMKQIKFEERIASMDARINRNQIQLLDTLDRIETKTDQNAAWMNESKGGLRLGKWIAGILTACGASAMAFIEYFK